MSDEMQFLKSLRAIKLSETQLPIVISAVATKANNHSSDALSDTAIKMFEQRRRRMGPSETFRAVTDVPDDTPFGENQEQDDYDEGDEIDWVDENGEVFPIRPKRHTNARNAPGAAIADTSGSIDKVRNIHNARPKGLVREERRAIDAINLVTSGANSLNLLNKFCHMPLPPRKQVKRGRKRQRKAHLSAT